MSCSHTWWGLGTGSRVREARQGLFRPFPSSQRGAPVYGKADNQQPQGQIPFRYGIPVQRGLEMTAPHVRKWGIPRQRRLQRRIGRKSPPPPTFPKRLRTCTSNVPSLQQHGGRWKGSLHPDFSSFPRAGSQSTLTGLQGGSSDLVPKGCKVV